MGRFSVRVAAMSAAAAAALCLLWLPACERGRGGTADSEAGAGTGTASARAGGIRVVVSIPPLKGLIEPLAAAAGGTCEAIIPVGVSVHGYEAPPSRLAAVGAADVIVTIGLGLEGSLAGAVERSVGKGKQTHVEVAELLGLEPADHAHDDHDHDHGHDGGGDTHLWLDPDAMIRMIDAVEGAIVTRLAASGGDDASGTVESVRAAALGVRARVVEIDRAYAAAFAGRELPSVVVAHDAYSALSRRYGLKFVAISDLSASEPTPGAVAAAVRAVRESGGGRGARALYVEPQLGRSVADRVAELTGARVLTLDPLGGGDWFAMMEGNLAALKDGLGLDAAGGRPSAGGDE